MGEIVPMNQLASDTPRTSSAVRALLVGILLVGCSDGSRSESPARDAGSDGTAALHPISVVLTFDDGPVDAHVVRSDVPARLTSELLSPLDSILATLAARGALGIFYLEGPGTERAAGSTKALHETGVSRILDGGHRIGFHAFDHSPALWLGPTTAPADVVADMNRIESFVVELVGPNRATPIFRPPYGGLGAAGDAAFDEAASRGWTGHGFDIDAVDWTLNATADPTLVNQLPVGCDGARLDYALRRLWLGAARTADREAIDVLFHVNGFTGHHLERMLQELEGALADDGRRAVFEVPNSYLEGSNHFADASLLEDLGTTGTCPTP